MLRQIPGRVGDAAVPGGGAYADGDAGGCGSTGDGDLHLIFMPCYQASALESIPLGQIMDAAIPSAFVAEAARHAACSPACMLHRVSMLTYACAADQIYLSSSCTLSDWRHIPAVSDKIWVNSQGQVTATRSGRAGQGLELFAHMNMTGHC
jgi:hypothetical protein